MSNVILFSNNFARIKMQTYVRLLLHTDTDSCTDTGTDSCESQPHKDLTSKLNYEKVPVLPSHDPSSIFPFHLICYPVHLTIFSFCFFPDFLAIFILLSLNRWIQEVAKNIKIDSMNHVRQFPFDEYIKGVQGELADNIHGIICYS